MSAERSSSFRPLRLAALVTGGLGATGALLAGFDLFANSQGVAEATGGALVLVFLAVLTAAAVHQGGYRRAGLLFGALAALLVAGVCGLWGVAIFHREERPVALSAAERDSLKASPAGDRLCSDPLGFSLPAPAPLVAAPELQARTNATLAARQGFAWAFEDPATAERLMVFGAKGVGAQEETFRYFSQEISEGIIRRGRLSPTVRRLTWTDDRGEYELSLQSSDGLALDFRCLATSRSGHSPPLIVCAQTVSPSSDRLRGLRSGLALRGC